ncbi:MAG: hypothetical protein ACJ8M1_04620 [Chthoniobacterales bacterium]|jgi:hypothetical protein
MKTHISTSVIVAFLSGCTLLGLTSCAEMESHNTKSLLTAAGFRPRTPETAVQKQVYAELESYKMERATYKGRTFYLYKDEKAGVAYVGHEPEYQRYTQLAIQQRMAQEYYMAVQMDRMHASRWYGAYGYRGMYW